MALNVQVWGKHLQHSSDSSLGLGYVNVFYASHLWTLQWQLITGQEHDSFTKWFHCAFLVKLGLWHGLVKSELCHFILTVKWPRHVQSRNFAFLDLLWSEEIMSNKVKVWLYYHPPNFRLWGWPRSHLYHRVLRAKNKWKWGHVSRGHVVIRLLVHYMHL